VVDAAKDATCTETGLTEGKHCSVCNAVLLAQETIPAKGHTEVVDAAKDATCTETGLTEGKHCSVCNTVLLAQETVAAKGHRWVDATCTAPKTCETCGETEGEPMPHAYGEWETVTEATKKAEGKREQVCADCGHTTEETIPMLEGALAGAVVGISLGSVAVLGGLFLAFVFLKKKKLF
jgi:hypothetical protein